MKFSQIEIESELSDAVPNGIKNDIARVTGTYPAIMMAWFNRDDERKSPQFQTLQIQAALDGLNPQIGEAHWQALTRLREASKPIANHGLCIHIETAKTQKETTDLTCAVLTDAPLYDQLKEALEGRQQYDRLVTAILEAINQEKETENSVRSRFGGRPVSTDTRERVQAKMEAA